MKRLTLVVLLLAVLAAMCGKFGITSLVHNLDTTPLLVAPGGPVPYPTGGGGNGGTFA
jgi:hypothetical protein